MPPNTKEERREERRLERLRAQKQAERSQRVRKLSLFGIAGAVGVAVIVIVVFVIRGATQPLPQPGIHLDDPVTAAGKLYQHVPDGQPISYPNYPPSFGNHYGTPDPWGVYTNPVPAGTYVHNLEHGGIVILYHCPNGCADTVTQLTNVTHSLPVDSFGEVKVVLSPDPQTQHLITLLAWDWREDLDSFDQAAITAFYRGHVDRGPEAVA